MSFFWCKELTLDKSQSISSWLSALILVRTFEICRARHMTKNWKYPCTEIIVVMDLEISVLLVWTAKKIYWKCDVYSIFNLDTGVLSTFCHVTCPANFNLLVFFMNKLTANKTQVMCPVCGQGHTWLRYLHPITQLKFSICYEIE